LGLPSPYLWANRHFYYWPLKKRGRFRQPWRVNQSSACTLTEHRRKTRLQNSIELVVWNETHGPSKRSFIRASINLLQRAFIIFASLGEGHRTIKIKIIVDEGIVVVL